MSSWTLRAQSPVLEVEPLLGEQKAYWLLDLSRQSDRSPASSPGTVAKLSREKTSKVGDVWPIQQPYRLLAAPSELHQPGAWPDTCTQEKVVF